MKTHTKDKKESKFLIQKQLKTAMATFKVTTYYNNLKNDKFSISFVYFPSNENGWKPKGFFFLGGTLKFESQRLHNIKYVGTKK